MNQTLLVFSTEVPTASLFPVVHEAPSPGPSFAVPAANAVSSGLTVADATSATNVAKTIRSPAMLHRISLPFDRSSAFLRDFADTDLKVRRPSVMRTSSNGPSPLFSTKKPSPRPTISPACQRRAISARSVCHSHPLQELVEKARIVARVVDDVGAEGREFAVERHRRLRNEVSTPDHAKALVRISRGSGMRQERRALDAVPRRAPTCDPVGTAPLAAHDRM